MEPANATPPQATLPQPTLPPQRTVVGWILRRKFYEWAILLLPLLGFVLLPLNPPTLNFCGIQGCYRVALALGELIHSIGTSLLSLAGVNPARALVISTLGGIVPLQMAGPEFEVARRRLSAAGVLCLLVGASA